MKNDGLLLTTHVELELLELAKKENGRLVGK